MDKPIPKSLFEFAAEEREFLHDLANPLAIAAGMLESYQDELARSGIEQSAALSRKLAKLRVAIDRVGQAVQEHRPRLAAIQAAAQKTSSV